MVIGKAARPRCFGKAFNPETLVHYAHNATAWMTANEFTSFLKRLDTQMSRNHRHIILLVENCPSYKQAPFPLQAITLCFLPPNTTSHLEPLDAGIIQNFKVFYRKQLVFYLVDCMQSQQPMTIDLRLAIQYLATAWKCFCRNQSQPLETQAYSLPQLPLISQPMRPRNTTTGKTWRNS